MKWLARLIRCFWAGSTLARDHDLPFSAEEFANLIASGRPEDMKRLAQGLMSAPSRKRAIESA